MALPPEASRRARATTIAAVLTTPSARPENQPRGPLLAGPDRLLVSRFSYGITPALATQVRAAGGAAAWWERQLTPARVADPFSEQEHSRHALLRRVYSNRQVLEVMTDFWQDHLELTGDHPSHPNRRAHGDRLRPHALGRYEDLLAAGDAHGGDHARHPSTARRVATALARKFVREDAPAALVDRLVEVYLAGDTAVPPVLRALVRSPEFLASEGAQLRDAGEQLVATWRALGVQVRARTSRTTVGAADSVLDRAGDLGLVPFVWPRPCGAGPVDSPASSPSPAMAGYDLHRAMSAGWWPGPALGLVHRDARSWQPRLGMRLDELVDHLCRQLLHLPATPATVAACSHAVGYAPDEAVTGHHPVRSFGIPVLLATILDSPEFSRR